jgi:hypothetical protein
MTPIRCATEARGSKQSADVGAIKALKRKAAPSRTFLPLPAFSRDSLFRVALVPLHPGTALRLEPPGTT